MKNRFILLSAIFIAVGAMIDTAYAQDAEALPDLKLCARYKVWLDESQSGLAPYNHFFIRDYVIDRKVTDRERVSFLLPPNLTAGRIVPIELTVVSRQGAKRALEGPAGRASCEGAWVSMTCDFHFNEIKVERAQAKKYLTAKYGATKKRDALLSITMGFSNDPIGVAVMAPNDENCPH